MKTRVYNLHDPKCPADAVYCGRGSPWGNPFVIGPDGDRDEVCDKFENETLPWLDLTPLKGKNLKCFCKPKRCHCDSILKAVAALPAARQAFRKSLKRAGHTK